MFNDNSELGLRLTSADASEVVEALLGLARVIDPNDPDGLRDAYGQRREELDALRLSDDQFAVLRKPLYRTDEQQSVAERLRRIAASLEGQLPDDAPAIGH
jgi:hypothetical protein